MSSLAGRHDLNDGIRRVDSFLYQAKEQKRNRSDALSITSDPLMLDHGLIPK